MLWYASCIIQKSAALPDEGNQEGAPGCTQRQHLSAVLAGSILRVYSVLFTLHVATTSKIRSKQLVDVSSLYSVKQRKAN